MDPPPLSSTRELFGSISLEPFDEPHMIVWAEEGCTEPANNGVNKRLERLVDIGDWALTFALRFGSVKRVSVEELERDDGQREHQGARTHHAWSARGSLPERFAVSGSTLAAIWKRLFELMEPGWDAQSYFLRGIRSFRRACDQDFVDDRYELFCRSVETVVQTDRGRGAPQFREALAAFEERAGLTMRDHTGVYERRNEIVHGHRFLTREADAEAIAAIEDTARAYFTRLLIDREFFDQVHAMQQARVAKRAR